MDFEESNNVSTSLPGHNIFQKFGPHELKGWTPFHTDELKTETLIGFKITSASFPKDEGNTYVTPHLNSVISNSGYNGEKVAYISHKGIYADETTFKAANSRLFNGIAYYDAELDSNQLGSQNAIEPTETKGRVYMDGQFYNIDYSSLTADKAGGSFGGEFGAGLFPKTTVKWKDITTKMVYKGTFANKAEFEDAHYLTSGLAYYNKAEKKGYVYYFKSYHTFDELGITYKEEYEDDFDSFPRRTDAWNAILEAGKYREKSGWPPPLDDVMSQFLYSISIDPTPTKNRSVTIQYDVRIVTEIEPAPAVAPATPGPTIYTIEYRKDTYTYTKTLTNTLNQMISTALESFFAQFPEMDYSNGEIEKQ